jgi:hypothetical protein
VARFLASVHLVLAFVAFGIGNAVLGGGGAPAFLHLLFGIGLLVLAVALWRKSPVARWCAAVSLGVATLMALTLVLTQLERPVGGLLFGAVIFGTLEAFTFKQAVPFGRSK